MIRKTSLTLVLCFLLVASLSLVSAAPAANNTNVNIMVVNNAPGATEQSEDGKGQINWEADVIEAVGFSAPGQSAAAARIAAKVDAQRILVEMLNGVQVDANTTVKNAILESDVIATKVSGLLKGARMVKAKQMPDGSFQVVMQVRMYGKDSLAGALEEKIAPATPQPLPEPSPAYVPPVVAAPRQYTGVVVDASGLGLERSMGPMVYDTDGRVIYGNMYVDHSYVVQNGLVDYAASPGAIELVDNGQSRAGNDPVRVKAVSLRDNNHNIVISTVDGDAILAAAGKTGFLLQCKVVIKH